MITISLERKHDRTFLWQWDVNMRLQLEGIPADTQIDFELATSEPLAVKAYEEDGAMYADIPNILLQKHGKLTVYVYLTDDECGFTKLKESFYVARRPKPADYVYTETEVQTFSSLVARMDEIEKNGVTDEQIEKSVTKYLAANPIGLPPGGKAGQVLCKVSDADYDAAWADVPIPEQYGLVTYNQDKIITIT